MKTKLTFLATLVSVLALASFAMAAQQKAAAVKIINGPRVEFVGNDSAVIAWTTNTGGSSVIRYGTDKNNLNETAQAPYADAEKAQYQTHRVRIQHLKPNTTYFFQVDSAQGEGTGTEAKSSVAQFTTKGGTTSAAALPQSSQPAGGLATVKNEPMFEYVSDDDAVIAWTTDRPADMWVKYGTDRNNLSQTANAIDKQQAKNHRVKIDGLQPDKTYYLQIVENGQPVGDVVSFHTVRKGAAPEKNVRAKK